MSGFYSLSVAERVERLRAGGWLSDDAANALRSGHQVMTTSTANTLIENVIGVFGLPLAIAPNFRINGRDYLVPLVVEEPSIVAALSKAAADARSTNGFSATTKTSLLVGQIHLQNVAQIDMAKIALRDARQALLDEANAVHPRLLERGGGVRELEIRELRTAKGASILTVHVHVDTCDAMGANLVNTICEALAPRVASLCGGEVVMRILSNLVDQSVVTASVEYPLDVLSRGALDGATVRDRIILCCDIAIADPYRAATHNKGIMNGIDALAIATGNDWRAIEAGAHAYAAREGRYSSLTRWSVGESGALVGRIDIPLKVGTVGATLAANSAAKLALEIVSVASATELAEVMAAVGLAQNFSALRALATQGIQAGHMRLHARSLAAAAGANEKNIDAVVESLIGSGEIKDWKAHEILAAMSATESTRQYTHRAAGKIILLGEHGVVYGRRAIAVPIANAISARAIRASDYSTIDVPEWNLSQRIDSRKTSGVDAMVSTILRELDVSGQAVAIHASARIPLGKGLGSSAAIAVACVRACADVFDVVLDDDRVNAIAYECEKIAHGTPSGIDNTIASLAKPLLFDNRSGLCVEALNLDNGLPLVVAFSKDVGVTHEQVAGVRERRKENKEQFEAVFDQMDAMSDAGRPLLEKGRYAEFGALMNIAQGLLNAIGVSTADLEQMIAIARDAGAVGAKLTGAGGGGAIIALCPNSVDAVATALTGAGYDTLKLPEFDCD